jgi:hypothetical protein
MFVLKGILRAESQEKVLIYLLLRETGYAKNIAEFYGAPTNPIQKQLVRLEEDGVIVSHTIGKVRQYELNPRFPFIERYLSPAGECGSGNSAHAAAQKR